MCFGFLKGCGRHKDEDKISRFMQGSSSGVREILGLREETAFQIATRLQVSQDDVLKAGIAE